MWKYRQMKRDYSDQWDVKRCKRKLERSRWQWVSGSEVKGRKRKEVACLFRTASVLKGRMWVVLRRLVMLKENVRDTGGELGQGRWAEGSEKTRVKKGWR